MRDPVGDIWDVMATARTIRRFTDEPVHDATLARCLEAATWALAPDGAQAWRFVVLRSPELRAVVAWAAARATTARSSGDRSTTKRQAWALAPDGAQVAASRHRASVASSTGSSVNLSLIHI